MNQFDLAFEKVGLLVKKFQQGEIHYLSASYQESELRQDFLDDFFTALGWDVGHKLQLNPYEQEVKVEKGVRVAGAQKRADYSFSIAPNFRDSKFFVEAKKPSRNLNNPQDYFQSIRYGWHKGHILSVLTDFEEFHILDCRYTPDINYTAGKCFKKFYYLDYLDKNKFAEIYYLFSREAVAANSLEKVLDLMPQMKGKSISKTLFPYDVHKKIDDAFLEVIDDIRLRLAKAFKKNDEMLTSAQLTEATQRTIDRLVFIRFLEDKLIEQEHYVSEFGEKGTAWEDFISVSKKLDAKYNGVVFKKHFIDSEKFNGAHLLEFRYICQEICHLNSRFLYNEIPIHILGSIYERFLGKVVHANAKSVTVEEKPEVKKAGGVYYTPKYIVDYIVKATVGKTLFGKTPEQVAKLKFADIACGSGSFLISVFDCIIEYLSIYYQNHPDKAKRDKLIEKDGIWVLTIRQKQGVLVNNIYGCDIDQQATEVTQLSLALKMLEDETTATANEMQVLFHEKILPDMTKNIVCGNAIVGEDFISKDELFINDMEQKINPLNINFVFRAAMAKGGFDAIVGNPPYIDSEEMVKSNPLTRKYCAKKYVTAKGNWDIYSVFIERAISLLRKGGYFGYIVPNKFLSAPYGQYIKEFCSQFNVKEVIDYSSVSVFISNNKKISVYPVLLIVEKETNNSTGTYVKMGETDFIHVVYEKEFKIEVGQGNWIGQFDLNESILNRIISSCGKLEDCFNIESAATVSEAYEIKKILFDGIEPKENDFYFVNTGTIDKYESLWAFNKTTYIKNTYLKPIVDGSILKKLFPKRFNQAKSEKLVLAGMVKDLEVLYDSGKILAGKSTVIITKKVKEYDLHYLLALLNSKIYSKLFTILNKHNSMAGGYLNVNKNSLKNLPFKLIDFNNEADVILYQEIVSNAINITRGKHMIRMAQTQGEIDYWERNVSNCLFDVDFLICQLLKLNESEVDLLFP